MGRAQEISTEKTQRIQYLWAYNKLSCLQSEKEDFKQNFKVPLGEQFPLYNSTALIYHKC